MSLEFLGGGMTDDQFGSSRDTSAGVFLMSSSPSLNGWVLAFWTHA